MAVKVSNALESLRSYVYRLQHALFSVSGSLRTVVVVLPCDTIQSDTACHELYTLIYHKQVPR